MCLLCGAFSPDACFVDGVAIVIVDLSTVCRVVYPILCLWRACVSPENACVALFYVLRPFLSSGFGVD